MSKVGDVLRQARESQGKSLEEISAVTRIHRKFLDEIEQGRTSKLPSTYQKAFLKSFAREVGLDPEKVVGIYLSEIQPPPAPAVQSQHIVSPEKKETVEPIQSQGPSQESPQKSIDEKNESTPSDERKPSDRKQSWVLTAMVVLAVAGLLAGMYWFKGQESENGSSTESSEIVYDQAEQFPQDIRTPTESIATPQDSVAGSAASQQIDQSLVSSDSLHLEARAKEGVWLRILIDGVEPHEYNLPAGQTIAWKAKEKFIVTAADPSSIAFLLNGQSITSMGTSNRPLRDFTISRENLSSAVETP